MQFGVQENPGNHDKLDYDYDNDNDNDNENGAASRIGQRPRLGPAARQPVHRLVQPGQALRAPGRVLGQGIATIQ